MAIGAIIIDVRSIVVMIVRRGGGIANNDAVVAADPILRKVIVAPAGAHAPSCGVRMDASPRRRALALGAVSTRLPSSTADAARNPLAAISSLHSVNHCVLSFVAVRHRRRG